MVSSNHSLQWFLAKPQEKWGIKPIPFHRTQHSIHDHKNWAHSSSRSLPRNYSSTRDWGIRFHYKQFEHSKATLGSALEAHTGTEPPLELLCSLALAYRQGKQWLPLHISFSFLGSLLKTGRNERLPTLSTSLDTETEEGDWHSIRSLPLSTAPLIDIIAPTGKERRSHSALWFKPQELWGSRGDQHRIQGGQFKIEGMKKKGTKLSLPKSRNRRDWRFSVLVLTYRRFIPIEFGGWRFSSWIVWHKNISVEPVDILASFLFT